LKKWAEDVKKFQLHREIRALSWPAIHLCFLLASQDHKYEQWDERGMTSFFKKGSHSYTRIPHKKQALKAAVRSEHVGFLLENQSYFLHKLDHQRCL